MININKYFLGLMIWMLVHYALVEVVSTWLQDNWVLKMLKLLKHL